MLSITWLAIVIITSIFEPIFGHYTDIFTTIINQKKAIAVSLNTLILVKIYKVLHHFI
jgi:spore maturation protein SpmA